MSNREKSAGGQHREVRESQRPNSIQDAYRIRKTPGTSTRETLARERFRASQNPDVLPPPDHNYDPSQHRQMNDPVFRNRSQRQNSGRQWESYDAENNSMRHTGTGFEDYAPQFQQHVSDPHARLSLIPQRRRDPVTGQYRSGYVGYDTLPLTWTPDWITIPRRQAENQQHMLNDSSEERNARQYPGSDAYSALISAEQVTDSTRQAEMEELRQEYRELPVLLGLLNEGKLEEAKELHRLAFDLMEVIKK